MTPTETAAILRQFNEWRRGDEDIPQFDPRKIGAAIDAAVEMIERMERQKPVATVRINAINGNPSVDFVPGHHYLHHNDKLYLAPGAQPAQMVVAYLDLGVGGYMDIGTDLTDEALAALPKGRHMLGIVGTYGVSGYVSAQPAPSVRPAELSPVINWLRNGCDPMKAADELEMLASQGAKPCP